MMGEAEIFEIVNFKEEGVVTPKGGEGEKRCFKNLSMQGIK